MVVRLRTCLRVRAPSAHSAARSWRTASLKDHPRRMFKLVLSLHFYRPPWILICGFRFVRRRVPILRPGEEGNADCHRQRIVSLKGLRYESVTSISFAWGAPGRDKWTKDRRKRTRNGGNWEITCTCVTRRNAMSECSRENYEENHREIAHAEYPFTARCEKVWCALPIWQGCKYFSSARFKRSSPARVYRGDCIWMNM